ncbi:SRPBCC family protein [Ectothiorhodospiraceae bacterium 2226]|nr:SRPBCC family protein [Ectothiorhodospiraceae bacterium 2226]
MRAAAAALVGLLALPGAQAGEVLRAEAQRSSDGYTLTLALRVEAPLEQVRARLTDYANLHRLNDTLRASTLLEARPPVFRVRLVSHACVLAFCATLVQEQEVTELSSGDIAARLVPGAGDFRGGTLLWRFTPVEAGTEVAMHAHLQPDFWVPPVIGAWLLTRKLRQEARQTLVALEQGRAP